jgi:hypothetical protein
MVQGSVKLQRSEFDIEKYERVSEENKYSELVKKIVSEAHETL